MYKVNRKFKYSAFGLNILSEFLIYEFREIRQKNFKTDLIIKIEDLSNLWTEYADTDSYYYIKENFCMVRVPNVAIYKIESGNLISVSPFIGSSEDQIRLYLLGTCLGILLMQQRILPIHGSCITVGGKAYAIVGDSGVGKSTTASAFMNSGYKLLTDDVVAVTLLGNNLPYVLPSYPQQKLWQESLDQFGISSNQFKPIYDRESKFSVPVNESFCNNPIPLAGIFMLSIDEQKEIQILPVQRLERFPILYYNTYRNFMIDRSGLMKWHFEFSAELVNKLDFYRVIRPSLKFTANELVDKLLSVINRKSG